MINRPLNPYGGLKYLRVKLNKHLLDPSVQRYIAENTGKNIAEFLLKKSPFAEVSPVELARQIKGREVAARKFPDFLKDNIIFPPHLNLEQTSSAATARYKSTLIDGHSFLDLTAGFGIDAFYLSENFSSIRLVEKNPELLEVTRHNWQTLGRKAAFHNSDLHDFLANDASFFDVIYLDPARRDGNANKVFLLEDLSPDITSIQNILLDRGGRVMIKLSPLIDLQYLLRTLKYLEQIHIIAVKNEVREIVTVQRKKSTGDVEITCVNLETEQPPFTFSQEQSRNAQPSFADPASFIYIPNNALLKSGAYNLIAERFSLRKLHPNTHLYTSDSRKNDFPGRVLEMVKVNAKSLIPNQKFNILSKNYPLKPEQIKKKYKLKDGGSDYLIFTEAIEGKIILKSV